jgi:hypothetical protein
MQRSEIRDCFAASSPDYGLTACIRATCFYLRGNNGLNNT